MPFPEIEPYCVIILKNDNINIIWKGRKYIYEEAIDNFYQDSHKDEAYNLEDELLKTVYNNKEFDIKLSIVSGENKSYYDTENAYIEEFIFKGSQAYIWQAD